MEQSLFYHERRSTIHSDSGISGDEYEKGIYHLQLLHALVRESI